MADPAGPDEKLLSLLCKTSSSLTGLLAAAQECRTRLFTCSSFLLSPFALFIINNVS
jgi:hypothetical protein